MSIYVSYSGLVYFILAAIKLMLPVQEEIFRSLTCSQSKNIKHSKSQWNKRGTEVFLKSKKVLLLKFSLWWMALIIIYNMICDCFLLMHSAF